MAALLITSAFPVTTRHFIGSTSDELSQEQELITQEGIHPPSSTSAPSPCPFVSTPRQRTGRSDSGPLRVKQERATGTL